MLSIIISEHDRICTLNLMLHGLYNNSIATHEVVIVANRPDDLADPSFNNTGDPNMTLTKWIEWHKKGWLKDKPIKLIRLDDRPGKFDVYRSWNYGVKHASNEWLCIIVNCDFYFCPGWDRQIIQEIPKYDRNKNVFVPLYFYIGTENIGYRDYQPLLKLGRRVKESDLMKYAESRKGSGIYKELCGTRQLSWAPMIIHRNLFDRVGGFIEDPPYPDSHDLHFDDALRDRFGVYKIGCLESMVYHIMGFRTVDNYPIMGE